MDEPVDIFMGSTAGSLSPQEGYIHDVASTLPWWAQTCECGSQKV
jgi:hypothetical protein